MLKVIEINSIPYGSTCKIMLGIAKVAGEQGIHVDTASGYSYHPMKELSESHIAIGGCIGKLTHMILARFTGYNGCFSRCATRKLLRKMEREDYDIVHLHNVHGWYLNLPMMFRYLKQKKKKIVWTLHDCWTFTGQCPHYVMKGCQKWKTGCYSCSQCNSYPETLVDRSEEMYRKKKEWFTGLDAVLVTPSQWLKEQVQESFLADYPVRVINNGIDLQIFHPAESSFRKEHDLEDKIMLLGVSFGWSDRKGLDVIIELAKRLPEQYRIVLVGVDEESKKRLPERVVVIPRTQNQQELAQIYTTADLFINPTREDTYPTVNMEALACGTPVLTFCTGGSPEIVDGHCGAVVPCDDVDGMYNEILRICEQKPFEREMCLKRAKKYDQQQRFAEYVQLYTEMKI